MIDENLIRENYASMMDSQMIEIAKNDGHQLIPAAFETLQHEFQKRNLDQSYIESMIETKTLIHEHKIKKIKESIQEDYEKTIWNYILEEKETGASNSRIIDGPKKEALMMSMQI